MAEYRDIPEDEQKKAKVFFDRAKTVCDTGNYEYAIELCLQGLAIDPEARDAHQFLREISLKRKASGGKSLGMFEGIKLKAKSKDDKQNLLNAEKLLAYDPGNLDHMMGVFQAALSAGYYDTVLWIGDVALKANSDSKSPEKSKYLALKDGYKEIKQWKRAIEAGQYAARIDPQNMDLQTELKNLSARQTMADGNYEEGDFRKSIRNKDRQQELIDSDKDVRSGDVLARQIKDAEAGYAADPAAEGKLLRLVEFLEKTEDPEHENRAIELLEEAYARTKQFRFRQRIGKLKMAQMKRMERTIRTSAQADPKDEELRKDYEQFKKEQLEFELEEYTLWAEHYPTDLSLRFEAAARMFALKRWDETIPLLQVARSDPKIRNDATITLGRAFLEAGYVDEAIETLQGVIDEYQLKGDDRSKLMNYWQGRALEQKGINDQALKRYSQVAQWEFTYKDVQQRIKRLRSGTPTPPAPPTKV